MTYYTKSCPHCQYKYQIHSPVKKQYGSPIRKCSRCGRQFVDADFIEAALLPSKKVRIHRVSPFFILHTLAWSCFAILFWVPDPIIDNLVTLIPLGIGILLIIDDLRSYKKRTATLQEELNRSKARLSDPQYLLALQEIDYELLPKQMRKIYPRIVPKGSIDKKKIITQVIIALSVSAILIAGLVFLVLIAV